MYAKILILAHAHTRVQALVELESSTDIRQVLRDIYFLGAKEIDAVGKKAICVYVPVPQQKLFQKIQVGEEGRDGGRG